MASDEQFVVDNAPDDYQTLGFTPQDIATRLVDDNKYRVAEVIWRKKARSYLELVNTSESGSSRGNDALYARAVAEADRLDRLAVDAETTTSTPATERISSFGINRV